jgi:hypothetical protein
MKGDNCLICGRNIPLDETQFIIFLGEKAFCHCISHEGSKELERIQPLISEAYRLYKQNEAYKTTFEGIKHHVKYSNVDYFENK